MKSFSALFLILFSLLFISFNSIDSFAAHQTIHYISGYVYGESGKPLHAANIEVIVSDRSDCSSILFFESYPAVSSNGFFSIALGANTPLYTDYNQNYYVCIYVEGELQTPVPYGPLGQGDISGTLFNNTLLNETYLRHGENISYDDVSINATQSQDNASAYNLLNLTVGDICGVGSYAWLANGTCFDINTIRFIDTIGNDDAYNPSNLVFDNNSYLNDTIDARIASITYYPSQVVTVYGTNSGGNTISEIGYYDDDTYNVTEDSGSNPLEVRINFTDVNNFDGFIYREQYLGGSGHEISTQIWNYNGLVWESYGGAITDQAHLVSSPGILVSDAVEHIDGGVVQFRFLHTSIPGNTQHKFFIDFVQLIDGSSTLTTIEHDSLAGRDERENHPWALPTSSFQEDNTTIWYFIDAANLTYMRYGDAFDVSINVTRDADNLTLTNMIGLLYNFNDVSVNVSHDADNLTLTNMINAVGIFDDASVNATHSADNLTLTNMIGQLYNFNDVSVNATQSQDNASAYNLLNLTVGDICGVGSYTWLANGTCYDINTLGGAGGSAFDDVSVNSTQSQDNASAYTLLNLTVGDICGIGSYTWLANGTCFDINTIQFIDTVGNDNSYLPDDLMFWNQSYPFMFHNDTWNDTIMSMFNDTILTNLTKVDCSVIMGGTDGDFCVDATGGGSVDFENITFMNDTFLNDSFVKYIDLNDSLITNLTTLDCTKISGGTDGDFCADATGGGGDIMPVAYGTMYNWTTGIGPALPLSPLTGAGTPIPALAVGVGWTNMSVGLCNTLVDNQGFACNKIGMSANASGIYEAYYNVIGGGATGVISPWTQLAITGTGQENFTQCYGANQIPATASGALGTVEGHCILQMNNTQEVYIQARSLTGAAINMNLSGWNLNLMRIA